MHEVGQEEAAEPNDKGKLSRWASSANTLLKAAVDAYKADTPSPTLPQQLGAADKQPRLDIEHQGTDKSEGKKTWVAAEKSGTKT